MPIFLSFILEHEYFLQKCLEKYTSFKHIFGHGEIFGDVLTKQKTNENTSRFITTIFQCSQVMFGQHLGIDQIYLKKSEQENQNNVHLEETHPEQHKAKK